jgi:hypothetical protein
MEEEKHFPPGAEPETPKETEASKEEQKDVPAESADDKKPDEKQEEPADQKAPEADKKPEDEPKEPAPTLPKKPRSIYDDLKDTRKEKKAETERADAAEAEAARLKGLLDAKDGAKTPEQKREAADDIEAFATEQGLDAAGLKKLTDIILSKVPKVEMPDGLKPDEVAAWRADRAAAARQAEDAQIQSQAPTIKEQLSITEPKELDAVMAEVTRLAHTPEFHDKEVEYIVWKNQAALSKLVSPKKPSFESGGQHAEAPAEKDIDFSSGKVTPEQVASAARPPRQSYEVRSVKR